jgi:hypothetical protein
MQPCSLGGAPTAFARNKLEAVAGRTQQDRLKNAAFGDRIGKLGNRFFVEVSAWLRRVRANSPNFNLANTAGRLGRWPRILLADGIIKKRRQAPA